MAFRIISYILDLNVLVCQQAYDNENTQNILTVGTYSEGNLLVVYEINRQVFPTAPSPTTTHLIVCISVLSDSAGKTLAEGRSKNSLIFYNQINIRHETNLGCLMVNVSFD